MKPIIAITSGWEPGLNVEGWASVYINKGVSDCIYRAGGIPLVIPATDCFQTIYEVVQRVDAIIMSGEIMSIKHNVIKSDENNQLRKSNPFRYDFEENVLKAAVKADIAIMGICRGFQVMNVFFGGEVTDYDINVNNTVVHQQGKKPPIETSHSLNIEPNSWLHKVTGKTRFDVNSFHRQGIQKIAPNFKSMAKSDDENIEAIISSENKLILGFQFHPEMLLDVEFQTIFDEFVKNIVK